jgi:hypothetical protein
VAACWLGRPLPSPDRSAPISHGWGADLADRRDEREKCSSRREGAIEFYSIIQLQSYISCTAEIIAARARPRSRHSRSRIARVRTSRGARTYNWPALVASFRA